MVEHPNKIVKGDDVIHNLIFERCWADPVIDLYELNITCKNEKIIASASECWASDEKIDDLVAKIHQYANKEIKEFEGDNIIRKIKF